MPDVNIRIKLGYLFLFLMHASCTAENFYCSGTTYISDENKKINIINDVRTYDVDTFKSSSVCKRIEKIIVCKFTTDGFDEFDNKKYLVITKLRFNTFTRRVSESTYMRRDGSLTAATFNGLCELATIETDD